MPDFATGDLLQLTGSAEIAWEPPHTAGLADAERFALDHHSIDGAFYARLRAASFSDAEILDLTVCIGGWLALGRTLHVLGLDDACQLAP